MEDALKMLDKLTDEETWMAFEQNLKATRNVDERVGGVANTVVAVDDRVDGVDDLEPGVDSAACAVGKADSIDCTTNKVDDKVAEVIHGV